MKITKLVLHKYKRFILNNITTLTYTPKAKIQLIFGTNGSGKSSLLFELSPLPGNIKKDYLEAGYKEIHITHNNKEYILISGKEGGTKHNFFCDGVDLNDGRTKKVQLILCQQHFKLTPEIHEILINIRMFTSMSIMDRKRWLSSLSTIDYTYPINVYNKLKSRHRDIIGGLKILSTKISSLESKTITNEELNNYVEEYNYIQNIIYKLIERKENILLTDIKTLIPDIANEQETLKKLIKDIYNIDSEIKQFNMDSLKNAITAIDLEIKDLVSKLNNIKELKNDSSLIDIQNDIKSITSKMSLMFNKYKLPVDINKIDKVYYVFNKEYLTYIEYINILSNYAQLDLNQETISRSIDESKALEKRKMHSDNLLKAKMVEFTILENNKNKKELECNKCGNVWKEGFNLLRYNELVKEIGKLTANIATYTSQKDKVDKYLLEVTEYTKSYNNFQQFISNDIDIKNIIEYVMLENAIMMPKNISMLKDCLYKIKLELEEASEYTELNKILTSLKDKELLTKQNEQKLLSIGVESEDSLTIKLDSLYSRKSIVNKQISLLDSFLKIQNKIIISEEILKNKIKTLKKEQGNLIKNTNNEYYNNVINYFKAILTDLDKVINEARFANKNLVILNKEHNELLSTKTALEYGLKALSPTEGLIAKSILSFLGTFTENINNIISSIWSYKMELLPPTLGEDNDLDYKFKINIEDAPGSEDISKTSSGMAEVINLAHKIISMHLLKLEDYPLFLDEYGARFDPTHKEKAYMIAKELSDQHSQIFMVSHSQEIYSLYPNSELVILSNDNLFMSEIKDFNTCLVLS